VAFFAFKKLLKKVSSKRWHPKCHKKQSFFGRGDKVKSIVENAMSKATKIDEDRLEEFGTPKIMVIGAGGAGCNAVNRLAGMGISGAQLVAVNTDKQHLALVNDELTKILIGKSVTRGLGAGGRPSTGREAAKEAVVDIKKGK